MLKASKKEQKEDKDSGVIGELETSSTPHVVEDAETVSKILPCYFHPSQSLTNLADLGMGMFDVCKETGVKEFVRKVDKGYVVDDTDIPEGAKAALKADGFILASSI